MFIVDQRTYQEIAAELEIHLGTVMSKLFRGRLLLMQNPELREYVGKDLDIAA